MQSQKFKTVFMGTPEFAVPSLIALAKNPLVDLKSVVTMPDRPSGRGKQLQSPPVAISAKQLGIPVIQSPCINTESQHLEQWRNQQIDLIIVLAFAQFLSDDILNLPRISCLNIHTSLLPKYRGAAPIHYALLNADKTTGVSIQKMVKKMDCGPLLISKEVEITPIDNLVGLSDKLKIEAANCLGLTLSFLANHHISSASELNRHLKEQDDSQACFAPTIKKTDGLITDPELYTYKKLTQMLKAYHLWPGVSIEIDQQRMKIHGVLYYHGTNNKNVNKLFSKDGQLLLKLKNEIVRITHIQPPGKKTMSDTDFLKGYKGQLKLTLNKEVGS